MRPHPGTSDKAVLFSLPSSDSAVFFNKELLPLWEVLAELPDGTGLLGTHACRPARLPPSFACPALPLTRLSPSTHRSTRFYRRAASAGLALPWRVRRNT